MMSRDTAAAPALPALVVTVLALLAGLLGAGPAAAAGGSHSSAAPATRGAVGAAVPADVQARKRVNATFESRVVAKTNKRRARHGCRPLKVNASLRAAARGHSSAMASARRMAHVLPGGPSITTRIERAGYRGWRRLAENVAAGFTRPGTVVRAWMRSPGHRRNILDCRLREIGVGVVSTPSRNWWTQDFGRR